MNIAIVGAGLAGLSAAYFLLDLGCEVTLFDAIGIGGGASSVCSGLLHPYPGLAARRSVRATEALLIAKALIRLAEEHTPKLIADQTGIIREAIDSEQRNRLLEACQKWKDVEPISENHFLIHSGITVHTKNYLEGLWNAIEKKGAKLVQQHIQTLKELDVYDQIIVAAGYGIRMFSECSHLKVKFLKGQVLQMKGISPVEKSFISKGYIAHVGRTDIFDLGSTYEREFEDEFPNLSVAKFLLGERFLISSAEIQACKAGIRVCNRHHYLPIVERVSPKAYVFTGLGSRGLLYHGYFGRSLAREVAFQPINRLKS